MGSSSPFSLALVPGCLRLGWLLHWVPTISHQFRFVPNEAGARNVSHTLPGTFCSFMDGPADWTWRIFFQVVFSPIHQAYAFFLCWPVIFSPRLKCLLLYRGVGADHQSVSSLGRDMLNLSPQDFSIPCYLETAFLLLLVIQDLSIELLLVGCA